MDGKHKNAELIQPFGDCRPLSGTMSEVCPNDTKCIDELERELRNCSLEIGYLQDQLHLRNVDLNYIGEHVHSLELKLAGVETLHEKLKLLTQALMQSDLRRLSLMQELKDKEEERHISSLRIEELETSISSIALESQCEIESMRLDTAALEERCFEAERQSQKAAREKDKVDLLLEMSVCQFEDAQERINCLEMENKYLKQKLVVFVTMADGTYCEVVEHLNTSLKHNSRMNVRQPAGSCWDLLDALRKELPLSKEICNCEDVYCPFVSNPAVVTALDDDTKEEMKKMSNQIREFEHQVEQLKEELRMEKLKAKEEAEDLTQAMAELRYQMTDMLEEECKRRASIEQTSLRRIQDLEEQVRKEQNKCITAIRRFQEAHKLSEMQAVEIRHLKNALVEFRNVTDPETERIESLDYVNHIVSDGLFENSTKDIAGADTLDDFSNGETSQQALLEWYPDGKAPSKNAEK